MNYPTNILLLSLTGDIDVTSIEHLKHVLRDAEHDGCQRIVLNLIKTQVIDTAGYGFILSEARRLEQVGGLLSLINVSDRLYKIMARMRLVNMIPIAKAEDKSEIPLLGIGSLPLWKKTFRVTKTTLCESRRRLAELLYPLAFSADARFDMVLAVGEALGNAVDHTCCAGILMAISVYDDRVIVDVSDCGEGFSLTKQTGTPVTECHAERGRGLALMGLLVDSVTIEHKCSGLGMVVHLVKMFDQKS